MNAEPEPNQVNSAEGVKIVIQQACTYQGYEFGTGSYPDSVCIDGSLHDADSCDNEGNIYLQEEDVPCPVCRPSEAIAWWTNRNMNSGIGRTRARKAAASLVEDIRRNRAVSAKS